MACFAVFAQHPLIHSNHPNNILHHAGDTLPKEEEHLKNILLIQHIEIPQTSTPYDVIYHTGYALHYNEQHEQADWVAYELNLDETVKLFERTNKFLADPKVSTGSASNIDYKGCGYDRGHLAPAADMSWSAQVVKESFYYSNMSPQVPAFNRGIWKRVEEQVRNWAIEYQSVYIVTGPVLSADLASIGPDKVSVPHYYYKVILDGHDPEAKGIAFIIPNLGSTLPLQYYAVTIDSVQKLTNIDFFPLIPDVQEKQIETTLCVACWNWDHTTSTDISKTKKINTTTAQQKEERIFYTGPRGGKYYFSKSGKKVYVKK
ncbi:MAG: DNA/RNA non-specific endonuclease [Bacteroidia bacterium]|nr:DNA/RNA non-specific endonuclease [Bacteroidia bacterium]